ncbi:SDR family oxidoreductase [Quadrisphaera setariae]|uniref:SDR family oxidoreductase n=2 Tax=Quadrisphaera setariae TaxID=2593304 RepID=A0A5C8ZHG0_9ACTN|nr:SDR family oxidoreductase [Quadrisphaera setariae]
MGGAHARRLAADGCTLAVADRTLTPALQALADEVGGAAFAADLADPTAPAALVAQVRERLGDVDVLVANHAHMTMGPTATVAPADFWSVVDVNLAATFALVQAVLPGMERRGGGRVIVVASEWGLTGWPEAAAYAASKAGLVALVKTLGRELGPRGVLVNAVAPGVIDTPQLSVDAAAAGVSDEQVRADYAAVTPLRRIGAPEEVAAAVSLLADPALGAVVGQVLQVNGGTTRGRA